VGSPARNEDEPTRDEALYELDRYRRGFENLERHVRILDRERQKLAVVLNNARVGFLILDRQLRLTWANPMVATGSGLAPGHDLAGKACHEVLCRNDRPCDACPARQALHGVSPCHLEVTSEPHAPTRRWHVSAAQIRSPHGASEEVLVMIQDLTDLESLRRSESSLSAQKQVLEMIARGEPLGQVLEALCRKVESEAPEVICAINTIDPVSGGFHRGAAPGLPSEYGDLVERLEIGEGMGACGTAAHRKARVVAADLATDPFWEPVRSYFVDTLGLRACWSSPILGAGDRVLGTFALYFREPGTPSPRHEELIETYTHLARIAIERDRAAEEKTRLEEQLRHSQKMEAIGTLAGGVAHDFNNLMAGVLGYVSLLRQAPHNPERVLKAAGVIETAAHRASDLTTKLLGFARRGRYQSVRVNMNDVLVEVAALLGRTIDKGIDVQVEPAAEEPWIQGDPAQMHQVMLNLAVNARDAMGDSGRMTLFARVEPAPRISSGGWVVVGVSDTGPGIPPEVQARVFEPFFTTKATGKGSGMGLATAYGIVQSHGGELAFDSTPGRGATFRFRLPLLEPEPQRQPEAAAERAARVTDAGARPDARPPCILVIDDETMVREVCCDILIELGYQVLQAEDGLRGVELYRRERDRIDAVVLDMIMPRMSGRDCFRELKAVDPDVRVVLVTGYADEDATRQLIAEGMVGLLRKPYQVSQLAKVVEAAVAAR
jgi:signal transduction histidine kinase/CheY-like chemotaxis protein